MRYAAIGLVLLLVACAGAPETRTTNTVAALCDTYATVLGHLAIARANGRLSDGQIDTVDDINKHVDPFCLPGVSVNLTGAVADLNAAIRQLRMVQENIQ